MTPSEIKPDLQFPKFPVGSVFPPLLPVLRHLLCQKQQLLAEMLDPGRLCYNHSCHHEELQHKDHTALSLNSASLRLCQKMEITLHKVLQMQC